MIISPKLRTVAFTALLLSAIFFAPCSAQTVYTYNGHQYYVTPTQMTFAQARVVAQAAGGQLACLTSAAENQWVTQTVFSGNVPFAWIGGSDEVTEGQWLWDSGEPWAWTNWAPSEPNNINNEDACLLQPATNANGSTWNDGLLMSVAYALVEIATPVGAGVVVTRGGHEYFMTDQVVTWPQARQIATAWGGHIASITTAAENQWITSTFMTGSTTQAWIGCSDAITEGAWLWESGEPFSYTNWSCGEPNNNFGGQHFGQIWTLNFNCPNLPDGAPWDDAGGPNWNTYAIRAIIERPPQIPPDVIGGHFNGHTYFRTTATMSLPQARALAQSCGGYLACITSAAEGLWISSNVFQATNNAWIGCSDEVTEGSWIWDSGEPFVWSNWAQGQPDNYGNEDYCHLWTYVGGTAGGSTWNDLYAAPTGQWTCNALIEIPEIVALPIPQNALSFNGHTYFRTPLPYTLNGARANAQAYGGYIVCVSSPAENLWLTQNLWQGANQFIGCSDEVQEGVWVWDSGEPFLWSNWAPLEPGAGIASEDYGHTFTTAAPNGSGIVWGDTSVISSATYAVVEVPHLPIAVGPSIPAGSYDFGGHQYFKTGAAVTYAQARALAQQVGGYVVSINSADENRWLTQVFWQGDSLWIGCNDEAVEGTWVWESGEPFNYNNWYGGEPNNSNGGEDFGHWYDVQPPNANGRVWNDWGGPGQPGAMYQAIIEVPGSAPAHALTAPTELALGSSLIFNVLAPAATTQIYYLDFSLTGNAPGLTVPLLGTIPLNPPLIYTEYGAMLPGYFQNLVGFVDATGAAAASIFLPASLPMTGATIHGGGIFLDPIQPYQVGLILNGTATTLVNPQPAAQIVSPSSGRAFGGNTIQIGGANFMSGISVSIGGVPATNVALSFNSSITCTVPPHAPGAVDIVLTNPGPGPSLTQTMVGAYTYNAPTIAAVAPNTGFTLGGDAVQITGSGFGPGCTVSMGGAAASNVVVVNTTSITCSTPAHAGGAVDVVVSQPVVSSVTLSGGFTYTYQFPAPTLVAINIANGPVAGGAPVVITGSGFQAGAAVTLDGAALANVVITANSISGDTPAHALGAVDIVVTNPDTQSITLSGAFFYIANLGLGTATPNIPTPGNAVTVSGSGFQSGLLLSVGGVAVVPSSVSPTQLSFLMPSGAACATAISVINPSTQTAALNFNPAPVVTSRFPAAGPMAGGTTVLFIGQNYTPGMTVTFAGVAATIVNTTSTGLTVLSPPAAPGTTPGTVVVLQVFNPSGCASSVNTYTYQ